MNRLISTIISAFVSATVGYPMATATVSAARLTALRVSANVTIAGSVMMSLRCAPIPKRAAAIAIKRGLHAMIAAVIAIANATTAWTAPIRTAATRLIAMRIASANVTSVVTRAPSTVVITHSMRTLKADTSQMNLRRSENDCIVSLKPIRIIRRRTPEMLPTMN